MKKITKIDEGWGAMIKRDITSDVREEEITDFDKYVRSIKWVDLGNKNVLYAEQDYIPELWRGKKEDKDRLLSLNDIENLKLPYGVSIITKSQLNWLRKNCKMSTLTETSSISSYSYPSKIKCSREGYDPIFFSLMTNKKLPYYLGKSGSAFKPVVRSFIQPFFLSPPCDDYLFTLTGLLTSVPEEEQKSAKVFMVKLVKKK